MRRGRARGVELSGTAFAVTRRERRRHGWMGLVGIAVVATAGLLLHAHLSERPVWTVSSVEVSGNRSIATAELLGRLGIRPGIPWWRVSRSAAARIPQEEPRIRQVAISWKWPRGLAVRVYERESLLRVPGDPTLELSDDGVLMESCPDLDPADLPLLTGRLPVERAAGRRFGRRTLESGWGEILDVCRRSSPLWKSISEIHCEEDRSFQVFLRDGRKVILWEAGTNGKLKEELPAVLGDLREERVADAVLDLRFRDQLVVRQPASAAADSAAAVGEAKTPDEEPKVERGRGRS